MQRMGPALRPSDSALKGMRSRLSDIPGLHHPEHFPTAPFSHIPCFAWLKHLVEWEDGVVMPWNIG